MTHKVRRDHLHQIFLVVMRVTDSTSNHVPACRKMWPPHSKVTWPSRSLSYQCWTMGRLLSRVTSHRGPVVTARQKSILLNVCSFAILSWGDKGYTKWKCKPARITDTGVKKSARSSFSSAWPWSRSLVCTECVKNQKAHVFWGNNTFLQLHSVIYDIVLQKMSRKKLWLLHRRQSHGPHTNFRITAIEGVLGELLKIRRLR